MKPSIGRPNREKAKFWAPDCLIEEEIQFQAYNRLSQAAKLLRHTSDFTIMEDPLFKNEKMMLCVTTSDIQKTLAEVHNGEVGPHQGRKRLKPKLRTMSRNTAFHTLGLNLIGPITPTSSKGHIWILVATKYFTKWVEAVPLKKDTGACVADFLFLRKILSADSAYQQDQQG
ncbi:LOW QUALITY PROTEIN: hypothetical protein V2J09_016277 [Rumex salicifolius]